MGWIRPYLSSPTKQKTGQTYSHNQTNQGLEPSPKLRLEPLQPTNPTTKQTVLVSLANSSLSLKTLAFGDGPHADRLQPPRAALRRAAAPQAAPTAAPAAAAVYPGGWRGRPPEEGCRGGGRVRVALRRAARTGEARTWTLQGEPSPTSGTSPERSASFFPQN